MPPNKLRVVLRPMDEEVGSFVPELSWASLGGVPLHTADPISVSNDLRSCSCLLVPVLGCDLSKLLGNNCRILRFAQSAFISASTEILLSLRLEFRIKRVHTGLLMSQTAT